MRVLFIALFVFASPLVAETTAFWVSPGGDDAHAGTEALPFLTLERAMTAVRTARGGDVVTVYLADGTYRLTRPLSFDPEVFGPDGPEVVFRALPGAHPVVSGAVRVTGWTVHDNARNIHRATVGTNFSRQLYVDGVRAVRARTDVSGGHLPAGFLPSPVPPPSSGQPYVMRGGIQYLLTSLNPPAWRDPAAWTNLRDVEAVIKTQWKMAIVPLDGITPANGKKPGLLTMRQPAWTYANLYFQNAPKSCKPDKPGIWSFWQVTRFENAYEFLDEPGEFYIDRGKGVLYYIPRRGEDLATADVELPVLETLVEGLGTAETPVANLAFDGLTFAYATWLGPGGDEGYVSDQSGFRVTGSGHRPNVIGHVQEVARTHGNVRFRYARNVSFTRNTFTHLGGAALDLGPGSQDNEVRGNTFSDISSAAIQLGGVSREDARPPAPAGATKHNTIANNLIYQTGRELVDSAAIFVGFSSRTEVTHNTISHVPWAGIAIGWGWGLLDAGSFPGLDCADSGMWGDYTTPTINSRNRISYNRISHFLEDRWDGGAIYSTGQQGPSMADPLVIEGNVADHKTRGSGGNTFYTDGGSRYVLLDGNVSYDNPIGRIDLGPPPRTGDPLPYPSLPSMLNVIPYGGDSGGCRTYGDIHYENNYWMEGLIPFDELLIRSLAKVASEIFRLNPPYELYSKQGFFNICPYESYPVNLTYANNHDIVGEWDVPKAILDRAGIRR